MLIIITGVPGTGKTTISKQLEKRLKKKFNIHIIHLHEFAKQKKLFIKSKNENLVDLKKLKKELMNKIKMLHAQYDGTSKYPKCSKHDKTANQKSKTLKTSKTLILVEGHVACEISLPANFVFVLRCNPSELKKRLQKRKYSEEKIKENLLAEMLDYCVLVGEKNYDKKIIFEVETTDATVNDFGLRSKVVANSALSKIIAEIIKIISGKYRGKNIHIDYNNELRYFLALNLALKIQNI
ncbi:MAG: AAA family ATPase [Candidatus Micrarchaeota archaeon]